MTYTIVGANGFIGRRLQADLLAQGAQVFAPARDDRQLFERDLGRVIYCAGLTADFARRPAATVEAHAGLLSRLIENGRFEHIVYLSSTRLYDSLNETEGRPDSILRIDPANPRSLYDFSKGLGENLCLTATGGRGCVARLSGVFAWTAGAPGFLSEWLQLAARSKSIALDSATGVVRDYIHLDDTARILLHLSEAKAKGIVNVASGENVSNADIAEVFAAQGWQVSFARSTQAQPLPRCTISYLDENRLTPRRVRDVVGNYLAGLNRETD